MATDVSTSLPQIDLATGALLTVDAGAVGAVVTQLVLAGTYYPPGDPGELTEGHPLWLPVPVEVPV